MSQAKGWNRKLDAHEMIGTVVNAILPEGMGWVLLAIHKHDEYEPIVMSANVGKLPEFLRMTATFIEKNDPELKFTEVRQ